MLVTRQLAGVLALCGTLAAGAETARAEIGMNLGLGGGYLGYFDPNETNLALVSGFALGLDVDFVLSPRIVIAIYAEGTRKDLESVGTQNRSLLSLYGDLRLRINILTKRFVPYVAAGVGAWSSFLVLGEMDSSGTMGDTTAIALQFPISVGMEIRLHKYFSFGVEANYHLLLGKGLDPGSVNPGERNDFDVFTLMARIRIHFGVPDFDPLFGVPEAPKFHTAPVVVVPPGPVVPTGGTPPSSGPSTPPPAPAPAPSPPPEPPPESGPAS